MLPDQCNALRLHFRTVLQSRNTLVHLVNIIAGRSRSTACIQRARLGKGEIQPFPNEIIHVDEEMKSNHVLMTNTDRFWYVNLDIAQFDLMRIITPDEM